MKSKNKKKVVDGSRDLISGLPDAMLCHILSFLPTKEAASTTALAKRWRPLLAFVPNLDFDDSIFPHPRESESVMAFVDNVLALQENATLKRFHLKCKDVVDGYRVLDWLPKVLKRDVLDIDLHIPSPCGFCSKSSFYPPLPSEIFVSKTLVRLKIQFKNGVSINVEGDVSLPNLKTLHLDSFKIDTRMFNKLLSGCHVLEELVLVKLMWDESVEPGTCFVTVSIPTLKRLLFSRFQYFDEDEDSVEATDFNESVSFSFHNSNLVYLKYSDTIAGRYQQVSFDSLVEAKLKLRKTSGQTEKDKVNVTKLLMGICNVKILYLSYFTLKVLGCCSETMPIFENLIQLTIKTALDVGWESLPPVLNNCPNLQTLVFDGLHHKYTVKCGDEEGCVCEGQDDFGVEEDINTCLSSSPVKVIKIFNFGEICYVEEDIDDQIKQVIQFLETMPNLEQVIVYYNTPNDEDVMELCKQLQELPKVGSAKCEVQIISDIPNLS
ncbi:hypothetical protein CARUB_v10007065mg, partial [Capsella rubella]